MIKAAITPGTHPQSVRRNTITTDPHPRSTTANGGKIIANNTCKQLICFLNKPLRLQRYDNFPNFANFLAKKHQNLAYVKKKPYLCRRNSMRNTYMTTKRIALFDVAKAILIISVFVYHVPAIYLGWVHGTNETIGWLDGVNVRLVNSFFMAGFFCISGYFLNVQKPLIECIAKDARTILLPAFLFSLLQNGLYSIFWGNTAIRFHQYIELSYWTQISLGYWFLFALFINKLIMQFIIRFVKNGYLMALIALSLCVLGLALKIYAAYNCFNYFEALMMCPMTLVGYFCRQRNADLSRDHLRWYALGFVLTMIVLWVTDCSISGFNLASSFRFDYIPMALWLGLSGTAFVLYLSSWLERSKVLSYMGTLTLPMFCLNFFFIEAFLRLFMPLLDRWGFVWLYVPAVLICALGTSFALSALFNTKYLRWILGKID